METSLKKKQPDSRLKPVILALSLPDDKFVGCLIQFKKPNNKKEREEMGTMACNEIYEIIGKQKAWGYNKKGEYTMIEAFRVMCVTQEDNFGRPAHLNEIEFL